MISFNRIHSAVAGVHPTANRKRLLGVELAEGLPERLRSAPHLAKLLEQVKAEAERAKLEPLPELPFSLFHLFASDGSRKPFEGPYFERRKRLLALTLEAWFHPQQEDLETLQNTIWSICDEYTWALPAHVPHTLEGARTSRVAPEQVVDLFAAETAHALAETLYLLGERINPWIGFRVRSEIEKRIFQPLFSTPVTFHWESATHNWASVCGGAVGMAAMLLVEDGERLAGMIDRAVRAMGSFLEGYGADGCCAEGVGYWNYGFGYFVYFAEMLFAYTEGRINLLEGEKIKRISAFPAAVSLTGGTFVNFSDSEPSYIMNPGLLSRVHQRTGQPLPAMSAEAELHVDHCYRFPHTTRNVLWTDPSLFGGELAEGEFYFPDTSWLVDKKRAGGRLFGFAAKGGHNEEPHNHNDLGHFLLHVAGETLLTDLGAGEYTRDYFREGRYGYIHNGSQGHSVPLIGGHTQVAGRSHEAQILEYRREGDTLLFGLELTAAYPDEASLRSLIRTFAWRCDEAGGGAELLLTDTFSFAQTGMEVEETFISLHQPLIGTGSATWRGLKGEVEMRYDAGVFELAQESTETRDHHANPLTVYRTRLKVKEPAAEIRCSCNFICRVLQ
ncbi:heparinase II/III family protein [Paenibacillus thalictri]|nr:heparinase II/III family protein [Paenibacillus thalictri]